MEYITGNKRAELFDATTDNLRTKMQNTTSRVKYIYDNNYDKYLVQLDKVKLIHAVDTSEGSKTAQRALGMEEIFRDLTMGIGSKTQQGGGKNIILSEQILDHYIPSKDPLKIAHYNNDFISLEGVGRLMAIKLACKNSGFQEENVYVCANVANVSQESYEELLGVHQSYYDNEGEQINNVDRSSGLINRIQGASRWALGGMLNNMKKVTDVVGLTGGLNNQNNNPPNSLRFDQRDQLLNVNKRAHEGVEKAILKQHQKQQEKDEYFYSLFDKTDNSKSKSPEAW